MPDIDIAQSDRRVQYTAAASQTEFTTNFIAFFDDDVKVIFDGTELTLTTEFTVSGLEDEDGFTVTLVTPATGGELVTIYTESVIARTSQYQVGGRFDAPPFERDFDRITTILQEVNRNNKLAVSFSPDVTGITAGSIGTPVDTATLVFDGVDGSIIAGPTTTEISNAEGYANAAAASAAAAATSETNAATSEDKAEDWATKLDGQVEATDYSSKAYAIGGTGVTNGAGASKEWATTTGSTVDGSEYSAKSYAQEDLTGAAGGSAKDWAVTAEDTEVITGEYSAFHWAKKAEDSAGGGQVKISSNDTTAGYLEDKLLAGTGLSLSTQNDGGNETRTISQDINGASSATVASGDEVLIADADDSNNIKKTTAGDIANLASGGLVLLGTYSAINDTSVDIGSGLDLDATIDGTYDEYELRCIGVKPSLDGGTMRFRTSNDGGSTFDSGSSDYTYNVSRLDDDDTSHTYSNSTGSDSIFVLGGIGNAANESGNAVIKLFNPSNTALLTQFRMDGNGVQQDGFCRRTDGSGKRSAAEAVDALRIFMNSGTITSGKFKLYGVKKS